MRLLAILEYDGTEFEGFQVQKRGRTVQGELERVLAEITGESVRVVGGGRTDSGVHAQGQGAHFETEWNRSIEALQRALNAVLPSDLSVRRLVQVEANFSARYSAASRFYRYSILDDTRKAPLATRYALVVPESLNVKAMNEAAQCLMGSQDFRAFGSPPHGQVTIRNMLYAEVRREDRFIRIDLEANAFLYRMVRRIVGTLMGVGKGQMSVDEFREVIAGKRRAGQSVPPQGLCLVAVKYDLFQLE